MKTQGSCFDDRMRTFKSSKSDRWSKTSDACRCTNIITRGKCGVTLALTQGAA